MPRTSLKDLIAHHRVVSCRYYVAVAEAGHDRQCATIQNLLRELDVLERQIVEFPARSLAEFSNKIAYITELTGNDPYVANLIREGVAAVQDKPRPVRTSS